MTYHIYKDAQNQWRWYLQAANNRKIANSGEGYNNEADCQGSDRWRQSIERCSGEKGLRSRWCRRYEASFLATRFPPQSHDHE
jgi:hypothetical protein